MKSILSLVFLLLSAPTVWAQNQNTNIDEVLEREFGRPGPKKTQPASPRQPAPKAPKARKAAAPAPNTKKQTKNQPRTKPVPPRAQRPSAPRAKAPVAPAEAPSPSANADDVDLGDAQESVFEETAVSRIAIVGFETNNPKAFPESSARNLRRDLASRLNEVSYLTAVEYNRTLPAAIPDASVKTLAQQSDANGVLLGQVTDNAVRLYLRSRFSGRVLASWNLPIDKIPDPASIDNLALKVADLVIRNFPFKGYVTFVKGDKAQVNLGNRFNVKIGQRLNVFEFEGSEATFATPRRSVGEILITQTAQNIAIGQITRGAESIRRFNKVDIMAPIDETVQETATKYSRSGYVGLGGDFLLIDSAYTGNSSLRYRKVKLTLSPFPKLMLGYNRIFAQFSTGDAQSDDNNVRFLYGSLGFELLRNTLGRFSFPTILGATYNRYTTETRAGSPTPLVSATTYYPWLQQEMHWVFQNNVRFFMNGYLSLPIFSDDEQNGKNNMGGSFGAGLGGGLRIYLNPDLGAEGALQTKWTSLSYANNSSLQELIYGISLMAIYFF